MGVLPSSLSSLSFNPHYHHSYLVLSYLQNIVARRRPNCLNCGRGSCRWFGQCSKEGILFVWMPSLTKKTWTKSMKTMTTTMKMMIIPLTYPDERWVVGESLSRVGLDQVVTTQTWKIWRENDNKDLYHLSSWAKFFHICAPWSVERIVPPKIEAEKIGSTTLKLFSN